MPTEACRSHNSSTCLLRRVGVTIPQPVSVETLNPAVRAGDEEARARGTQKSILERKAPPTFPLVIEMRERACWVTHWVEDSVDCLLHGKDPVVQVRVMRGSGFRGVVRCPVAAAGACLQGCAPADGCGAVAVGGPCNSG